MGNLTQVHYPLYPPSVYFSYDSLNRLTNTVDVVATTEYSYTAGNQLLTTIGPFANDAMTNTYANRLRTGLSLAQPDSYAWTQSYGYDPAKRLTSVTSPAGTFAYQYVVGTGSTTSLISSLRLPNGAFITNAYDLSETLEGAGGIGGLLARSDTYSGGSFTRHNYYHADGNGNITYLETSSQSLAAGYRYDPFGNTISSSGTLASANVYRFSSKECHTNSGMCCYLYRFYDPNLQRWINRDPLGEAGFEVLRDREPSVLADGPNAYRLIEKLPTLLIEQNGGLSLYRFVSNEPLGAFDPWGLATGRCGGPAGSPGCTGWLYIPILRICCRVCVSGAPSTSASSTSSLLRQPNEGPACSRIPVVTSAPSSPRPPQTGPGPVSLISIGFKIQCTWPGDIPSAY